MHKIKFYVIGLLFLFLTNKNLAQNDQKVHLGFTVNPNIVWLSPTNEGYNSDGAKLGLSYGVLTDFRLFGVENYSLSSGFTFSHLGGKITSPDAVGETGSMVAATRSSNYSFTNIDVPMVIRLKTNEIGYNVFYGTFGTEFGFNLNAKEKYTQTYGSTTTEEKSQDISSEVSVFRTSLVFGFGMERSISGNTGWRFGLTFHNGLTNIFNGKTYLVDANGTTVIDNGSPVEDRDLFTKLNFLEVNFSIIF